MNPLNLADIREDYQKSQLLEANLPSEPIVLLELWLKDVLEAKLPDGTAFALATCIDARPSCRIVLLKGIHDGRLTFYTHYTSRKGIELAANPNAAATFFWASLERQVRVEGVISKVPQAQSQAYFSSRPYASQLSASISPQSQVVPNRAILENWMAEKEAALQGGSIEMPEGWGGYFIDPHRIEFWQGGSGRLHDRLVYTKEKEAWSITRLAP